MSTGIFPSGFCRRSASFGSSVSASLISIRSSSPRRAALILTLRPNGDAGEERRVSIGSVLVRDLHGASLRPRQPQARDMPLRRCAERLAAEGREAPPREALREGGQQDFGLAPQPKRRVDDEQAAAVEAQGIPRVVDKEFQTESRP